MEYTKGNWERYNAPNGEHIWCGSEHIADFDGKNASENARLCVSAPKLYEALKELCLVYYMAERSYLVGTDPSYWKKALKIIAKVEGK